MLYDALRRRGGKEFVCGRVVTAGGGDGLIRCVVFVEVSSGADGAVRGATRTGDLTGLSRLCSAGSVNG